MAISAKASFIYMTEKKLCNAITASALTTVLTAVSDVMESFDLREIADEEQNVDLLTCYLDAMRIQGRSEKTVNHYYTVLKKMIDFVRVPIRQITAHHLRSYLAKLKDRKLKDSTLEGYRQVFSAYFGWLFRESLIEKNPVDNLGAIKVPKVVRDTFSDIDMEKLRQSCTNIRDRSIIAFLSSTGCRVSEICELNRDQVDLINKRCVVHGKGNKERTVYIDPVTAMLIQNYFDTRKDDADALFANRYGERFQTGGIRELMKRLEERSNVTHVHPHKFRRTYATNMARRGMPIQTIAKLMGHDNVETTMTYVVMNEEDTRQAYRQYYAS